MRDSEELMNLFRTELRRAVMQRYKRVDLDRFKAELKDYVSHFLYEQTQRSPIVIPVVNTIDELYGTSYFVVPVVVRAAAQRLFPATVTPLVTVT